jgi:hypothetical protein
MPCVVWESRGVREFFTYTPGEERMEGEEEEEGGT